MGMIRYLRMLAVLIVLYSGIPPLYGYLHTDGPKIVNTGGEEVLLRGFGLGGWLVPEGYMLKIPGYGSPTTIRNRITDLIGEEGAGEFYANYRNHYVTRQDIDTIASWGMNSVRIPMHYRLLSPEPGVYLESGFAILDTLLTWCEANRLYLILDMHCAPGGQNPGNISDAPEGGGAQLWTHPENQDHLVNLWGEIAARYARERWIGGYDLINEPVMPEGYTNADLRALYIRIRNAIRDVDTNHILFIEGNWYATDFDRLTPPFDGNMVYAFHKYWNETNRSSINPYLQIRNQWGVPLWLGESGENSNPWFYQTIALMEANKIGWNWWTHKKVDTHTSPYSVPRTEGYNRILKYWNGNAERPPAAFVRDALLEFAGKFALDSCEFRPDVLAAITDRESGIEPRSFTDHAVPGNIPGVEYDMGTQGKAYNDADYIKTRWDVDQPWNRGGEYRNDGVDIVTTTYQNQPAYAVGFIEAGEWVSYTVSIPYEGSYRVSSVISGKSEGGQIHLSLANHPLTETIDVPVTGGWESWETLPMGDVDLPAGKHRLKLQFHNGGFNLLRLQFTALENESFGTVDSHTLLGYNYPNPFNTETRIPILVSRQSNATVRVYDISGSIVNTLFTGLLSEGLKTILWDGQNAQGEDVSSGIYYYAIEVEDRRKIRDMVMVR